jgi:hypothetical protein
MIKKTSLENPNDIVSIKDNVVFCKRPRVEQFAKKAQTNLILSSNRIWFGYFS